MISNEAIERKRRSEAISQFEGVPTIPHLPVIEDAITAKLRTIEEVAWRAMALNIVAVKAEGLEQERVLEIIEQYNLETKFTPKEREFIFDEMPSEQNRTQFVWRYESYWLLLWAINYIEELARPDQICDVPRAVQIMVDKTANEFVGQARLRSEKEILDEADLIYRYNWACVDARLNGKPIPAGFDSSVVYERHYALNWLIGYSDQDWDDVTCDT